MKKLKLIGISLALFPALAFGQPHIAAVVSGADFTFGIALGGFATVFGTGLADGKYQAPGTPYPLKLGSTELFVCLPGKISQINASECVALQVIYASPSQVNFLLFSSLPQLPGFNDTLSLVVRVNGVIDDGATSGQSLGTQLTATPFGSGGIGFPPESRVFFEGYDCLTDTRYLNANNNCGLTLATPTTTYIAIRGAVTDQQGRLLSSANRARFGQYYTVWLTGLELQATAKFPISMALTNIPTYMAGGKLFPGDGFPYAVTPSYVGASPVYPGLYQINFQLLPPKNSDGPQNAFPCGPLSWEFGLSVSQGYGSLDQIPISVMPGDLACGG